MGKVGLAKSGSGEFLWKSWSAYPDRIVWSQVNALEETIANGETGAALARINTLKALKLQKLIANRPTWRDWNAQNMGDSNVLI